MSSYISSFKALVAALVMIAAGELGYATVDGSSPVERSTYINWNFNEPELFHKGLIYEKIRRAIVARPDIIQVGDSSGLHAIVPGIVEKFIPGLTYENLSCCANMGYDGYYTIAEFMLRHVSSIKAVVLYLSWNNTMFAPDAVDAHIVGSPDRLRGAFGPLAGPSALPSMASREDVLRSTYTLAGQLEPLGSVPLDRRWPAVISSIRKHQGWLREQDIHRTAAGREKLMKDLCGNGTMDVSGSGPTVPDILGRPQSYLGFELTRLAQLTARHGAKLVVAFQPHPCRMVLDNSFLTARRADIAKLIATYPNVEVPAAPQLFEHWPAQRFTSADHLRTGYEDAASRRLGRELARVFRLPPSEPPSPAAVEAPRVVWSTADFSSPPWRHEGVSLASSSAASGTVLTETANAGWHRIERSLPDLPRKTYVFSVISRSDGAKPRQFALYMTDLKPGDQAIVRCNPKNETAFPIHSTLDWGIDDLPDRRVRCWGKFKLNEPGAVIGLVISDAAGEAGPHQGDGAGSVLIYDFEVALVDEPVQ